MNNFFKIIINYLVIILMAFLFECIFNKITSSVILNLFENFLFALVLVYPLYLIDNKTFKKYYFKLSFTVFTVGVFFETVYYYLFKTSFSPSAIFVSLDSNSNEAKEFLGFYIDKPIIVFTSVIFIVLLIILLKTNKLIIGSVLSKKLSTFVVVDLFLITFLFLKFSALIVYNSPYLIVKSSTEYVFESRKLGDYRNNKNGNFVNLTRLSKDNEPEIYVVIIGESTSRSHMGIYDYYRQTTPLLKKIEKELLIYNNVISPHAYSIGALTKILTMGNYENPEGIFQGNIIQLLNKAGFETYWLSNQRPIGPYESMITKISLSAKNYKFLTTTIAGNSKVLDGELLSAYQRIINNDKKKKVIFIHMMGAHHQYENRYPESFRKFLDEPITNFKSTESFEKINHYDNAILYNDFIISEIISKLDSLNTKSFALYFSDHGEEMYTDLNMAGHNEDIYSKEMLDIPFFLWRSEEYKQSKTLYFNENRKYMIDDLFHSVADLLDISSYEINYSRSIFNENFIERKRMIKDTIDYDFFFN